MGRVIQRRLVRPLCLPQIARVAAYVVSSSSPKALLSAASLWDAVIAQALQRACLLFVASPLSAASPLTAALETARTGR